jgi:peptidyl-prolyl cis-trans isomerase D
MSNEFQKKTGSILATGLIGLIIISFMFTGYETMTGTPDSVAKVGDLEVKFREYRLEYDRQVQMYSNFTGKPLTAQQIQDFQIKEGVIRRLVSQKLLLKFADELGITPAQNEVVAQIKELPYFRDEATKQFDINRYKGLLAANQITPTEFEQEIHDKIKAEQLQNLFKSFPLSNSFMTYYGAIKNNAYNVEAISISKSKLETHIAVSPNQIKDYLANEENGKRVSSMFETRKKEQYDRPEMVKARHILLQVQEEKWDDAKKEADRIHAEINIKNFASLADKYSQDPGNSAGDKKKGGDLGWFGRGRMVPEFEQAAFSTEKGQISSPVKTSYGYHIILVEDKTAAVDAKFEEHKDAIAKELIQKDSKEELKKLTEQVQLQLKSLLEKNDKKQIETLVKQYGFEHVDAGNLNQLDGLVGRINITTDNAEKVFSDANPVGKVFEFNDVLSLVLLKVSGKKVEQEIDGKQTEQNSRTLSMNISRQLNEEIIKELETKYPVKIHHNRI